MQQKSPHISIHQKNDKEPETASRITRNGFEDINLRQHLNTFPNGVLIEPDLGDLYLGRMKRSAAFFLMGTNAVRQDSKLSRELWRLTSSIAVLLPFCAPTSSAASAATIHGFLIDFQTSGPEVPGHRLFESMNSIRKQRSKRWSLVMPASHHQCLRMPKHIKTPFSVLAHFDCHMNRVHQFKYILTNTSF